MSCVAGAVGSITNPIRRQAARVLLIDGAERVLLLRGFDPRQPDERYWFTVGGGLDEGETPAEAAVRELAEETGLLVQAESLGRPVWHDVTQFPFDGRWYRQEQDFYAVRVQSWNVVTAGFDSIEQRSIDGHHWWSVAELTTTAEQFYPKELTRLMLEVLRA